MSAYRLRACLAIFAIFLVPVVAAADAVTEWNEKTVAASAQAKELPAAASRTVALVHTAMFDAINSVEGRYSPYKFKVPAPSGSSPEAAGAAAAHAVLLKLFPEQKGDLDGAFAASLAKRPVSPANGPASKTGRMKSPRRAFTAESTTATRRWSARLWARKLAN